MWLRDHLFIPCCCWVQIQCMDTPRIVYPFSSWWAAGMFLFFGNMNKAAKNNLVQMCVCVYVFSFFWINMEQFWVSVIMDYIGDGKFFRKVKFWLLLIGKLFVSTSYPRKVILFKARPAWTHTCWVPVGESGTVQNILSSQWREYPTLD